MVLKPRRHRKHARRAAKRRHHKRKIYASARNDLVVFDKPRFNQPLPQRYRTVLTSQADFYVNAGHLANVGGMFVGGNYPEYPFAPYNTIAAYADQGDFKAFPPNYMSPDGVITRTTQKATGFSSIISASGNTIPWTTYRVFASAIEISVLPQNVSDVTKVAVIPVAQANQPTTPQQAAQQQFGKMATFSSSTIAQGAVSKHYTLKNYVSTRKMFGMSNLQMNADLQDMSGIIGQPPTQTFVWKILMQQCDAQATGSALSFRVKVRYYIEAYWPSQTNLIMS